MIADVFRTSLRALRRRKIETVLMVVTSVLGSVGLAMAVGYAYDYYTADTFHNPPETLYQVNDYAVYGEYRTLDSWTLGLLTPWMRDNVSAVRTAGRYRQCSTEFVRADRSDRARPGGETRQRDASRRIVLEDVEVTCMESTMFSMLSFPTVYGDPVRALERPDGAVITDETAEKLFGTADAVGRTVDIHERDSVRTYRIGAVIEAVPANSHIRFDIARSWLSQPESVQEENTWQYVELKADADTAAVASLLTRHVTDTIGDRFIRRVSLLPFADVFYESERASQHHPNALTVTSIIALGASLFAIALLNLIGLRMARAGMSIRQIGTRLTVGASHTSIGLRTALDTIMLAPITAAGVAGLALWSLPRLNAFSESGFVPGGTTVLWAAVCALVMLVVAGGVSGVWIRALTKRRPIAALVRGSAGGTGRAKARRVIITAQMAVFVALLTAAGFLQAQFDFLDSVDRGHAEPEMLLVRLEDRSLWTSADAIAETLSRVSGVERAVRSAELPGSAGVRLAQWNFSSVDGRDEDVTVYAAVIDTTFIDVFEVPLVAGRNVRERSGDVRETLLNERAIDRLGFESPQDALGYTPNERLEVVGVVADFAFESLHEPVKPMMLTTNFSDRWFTVALLAPAGVDGAMVGRVRDELAAFGPDPLFTIEKYSSVRDAAYADEYHLRRALSRISYAALLLVVAGLWSVSALSAAAREREFGIRKVLGARNAHVFGLHLRAFAIMLSAALVVGAVPGYMLISAWLDRFAFRTDAVMQPVLAVALALGTATLFAVTVSSFRFLVRRPVDALAGE